MSSPMRITFVLPAFDKSGGGRVVAHFAEMLHRRGHRVVAVAPPFPPLPWKRRVKALLRRLAGQPIPDRGSSHFDGFSVERHQLDRYRPVTDRDVPDADLVIATWWETAEWVAALSPSKGVKAHLIQNQEGNPIWCPPELIPRATAVYRLPLARVTVSRSVQEWLENEQGCRDVAITRQGVDLDLFHAPPRGRQPRPTVGLQYHRIPFKGLTYGLKALEQVRKTLPDLHVVAFGLEPDVPELALPAGTSFHLNPPQTQIRELYASCDVWLCSSLFEGFHLPPMEAMACRCPVVSTRVGGPDQMIEDGVNGYLVPIRDVDALADRLLRVLRLDAAAWHTMSDAAHATARSYTWESATDCFENILRGFLARRPSP